MMTAPSGGSESALGLSNMIPRTPSKLVKPPPKPSHSSTSTTTLPSPVSTLTTSTSSTTATTTTGKLTKPMPGSQSRSRNTVTEPIGPVQRQASTSTSSSAGSSFVPNLGPRNSGKVQVFYPRRTRKSSHPALSTTVSEPRKEAGPRLPRSPQTDQEYQSPPERIAAMLRRHQSLSQPMSNTSGYPGGVPVPVLPPQVPSPSQMIPPPPRGDSIQGVKQKLLHLANEASLLGGESGEEVREVEDGSRGSNASQRTVRKVDKGVQHPEGVFDHAQDDDPEARPTTMLLRVLDSANDDKGVIHSSPPPMFNTLPDLHPLPSLFASPPSTPSQTPIVVSPRTSWFEIGPARTPPRNYSLPFGTSIKSHSVTTDFPSAVPRIKRTRLSSPVPTTQRLSAESSETSAGGDSALFSSPNSSLDLPPRITEDPMVVVGPPPSYTPREMELPELFLSPEVVAMLEPEPERIPDHRHTPHQPHRPRTGLPPQQLLRVSDTNSASLPPPALLPPPPPVTRRVTRSQTLPLPGAMTTPPRLLPTPPPTSNNPFPLIRPTASQQSSSAPSLATTAAPPLFYSGPSIVTSANSKPKSSSVNRATTGPLTTSTSAAATRPEKERSIRSSTSKPTHTIAPSLDANLLRPTLSHHSQSFSNAPRPAIVDKNADLRRRHSAAPSSSSRPRSSSIAGPASSRGGVTALYDPQTGAPILPKSVRFSEWSNVRTFVHESWEPKGVMKPRYDRAPAGLSLGMGAEDIILADASGGGVGGGNSGGIKLNRGAGSSKMRSLLGFVTKANR